MQGHFFKIIPFTLTLSLTVSCLTRASSDVSPHLRENGPPDIQIIFEFIMTIFFYFDDDYSENTIIAAFVGSWVVNLKIILILG